MIQFIKKNIVPLAILILGVVFFIMAMLKNNEPSPFKITPEEMLVKLDNVEHVTNSDALEMQKDTDKYIFVDLRSPYDFEVSHIENALNIPTAFLLDNENVKALNDFLESEKTVVLYGKTEREAISPWYLLYQMGLSNTKILYGGFECFTEKKADCPNSYPKYDYAKISKQGGLKEVEVIKEKPKAPAKKKAEIRVQKKVKAQDEGGC